jgi:hypothetical protein
MADQKVDLDRFYREEKRSGPRFLGQLNPEFQNALAQRFEPVTLSDCDFYHTMVLRERHITAEWDLRGDESAYTGGYPLEQKRVIEFGPASGFLTAYLDRRGADVTVFDLPPGGGPELVPYKLFDLPSVGESAAQSMDRLRNSWWYARRTIGFRAAAVYGDIYDLPTDLGRFDVAFFGAILCHLSNPFLALRGAAALADEALIVTEVLNEELGISRDPAGSLPVMLFNPTLPPQGFVHWWALSPAAIERMLQNLGFIETKTTVHRPPAMSSAPSLFTVVGRRANAERGRAEVLDTAAAANPHAQTRANGPAT